MAWVDLSEQVADEFGSLREAADADCLYAFERRRRLFLAREAARMREFRIKRKLQANPVRNSLSREDMTAYMRVYRARNKLTPAQAEHKRKYDRERWRRVHATGPRVARTS